MSAIIITQAKLQLLTPMLPIILYGRRPVYVISFMAFTVFSVAAPVSPNIQALFLFRFFGCAFGSSSMTNGGGVITNMLTKEQRGAAMGAFVTAPFLGPALGK
jgi:MFS family permease